jgi:hypothetical protein
MPTLRTGECLSHEKPIPGAESRGVLADMETGLLAAQTVRRQRHHVLVILAVATSLVGAGGVLVGVLMTALTRIWLENRRAGRNQRRESERRSAGLRLAVRLVVEELSEAEEMIREAARVGHYWPADRQLPDTAWAEHGPTLAAYFPGPADWRSITAGYKELRRLDRLVNERRGQLASGDSVSVETGDDTLVSWHEIQHTIWVLEANIDMADDTAAWLVQMKRLEQVHWGCSLQPGR